MIKVRKLYILEVDTPIMGRSIETTLKPSIITIQIALEVYEKVYCIQPIYKGEYVVEIKDEKI